MPVSNWNRRVQCPVAVAALTEYEDTQHGRRNGVKAVRWCGIRELITPEDPIRLHL